VVIQDQGLGNHAIRLQNPRYEVETEVKADVHMTTVKRYSAKAGTESV
jgi:hypothetical protein